MTSLIPAIFALCLVASVVVIAASSLRAFAAWKIISRQLEALNAIDLEKATLVKPTATVTTLRPARQILPASAASRRGRTVPPIMAAA